MFGNKKADDADCPLWQAPCKGKGCRWSVEIQGTNQNTGQAINERGCAVQYLPALLIELSAHERQTGASIDRFNNDMVIANGLVSGAQNYFAKRQQQSPPQLAGEGAKLIGGTKEQ